MNADEIRIAHTSCMGAVNFFEMYFDKNKNANPSEGTGFNDGTLIYSGDAIASGVFHFQRMPEHGLPKVESLDAFGHQMTLPV